MISLISLNSPLTYRPEKIAVICGMIALISALLCDLGNSGYLPIALPTQYIITGISLLFFIDAIHYTYIFCKKNKIKKCDSLKELEEINLQTCDGGVKGRIIFVDVTVSSSERAAAIETIKKNRAERSNKSPSQKKCHFGLASFVNFSIAAANKSDKIILFDYDPVVVRFNKIARDILINSSDSKEFRKAFTKACQQDKEICRRKFYPKTLGAEMGIANLSSLLQSASSFLSQEEDFQHIKHIAMSGHLHIYQGDIYDTEMINRITALTEAEGATFHSLFISNVYDWDRSSDKRKRLIKNIETLSNDETVIVEVIPSKDNYKVVVVDYVDSQSGHRYHPEIMRKKIE